MSRRPAASIVASPVLVGAVTVLVTIVAVFLAYNANTGLPFVPTYDVQAEVPGGANLVAGNEVRLGGFRIGFVDDLRPIRREIDGEMRTIAVLDLKLDRVVDPLPADSTVLVRPRSALGLKYVEVTPGTGSRSLEPGDTIALSTTEEPLELDDVFKTFDSETRDAARIATAGAGDAFAGRGQALNAAIAAFVPFFRSLEPVMRNLSDPRTNLDDFLRQIGNTSRQVAPVAEIQARIFSTMADTFAAISDSPAALRETIEEGDDTLAIGEESFRAQRPFLADFADLSRRLQPAAARLPAALPDLNSALRVGRPVLVRSVALNRRTEDVFDALHDLASNPSTLLALRDLADTTAVGAPLLSFVAPYQTVCNNWNYYWGPLGEHQSEPTRNGFLQRIVLRSDNRTQPNRISTASAYRPADVPANMDPDTAVDAKGDPLTKQTGQVGGPAIDAAGNADCQNGQLGSVDGPLIPGEGRYPPSNVLAEGGGNHVVVAPDTPGLAGPTFTGIPSLQAVDEDLRNSRVARPR